MYQQQYRRQNQDDCDCGCQECCGDDCCKDCCGDCECQEFGCDGCNAIQTDCLAGCQCCACMACCTAGDILTELNFHRHIDEEEENKVLSEQFKEIIQNYRIFKQLQHPLLKDTHVLHKKKNAKGKEKLLLKSYWFMKQEEYQKCLRLQLELMNQGTFIQGIYALRIQDICVDRWRVCVLYQKLQHISKQQQIQYNKLISQISSQLLDYHQFQPDQNHFDLKYLYYEEDYILVPYKITGQSQFELYQQDHSIIHPPEWENKQQNYDHVKSDAFLFGIALLQLILKIDPQSLYYENTLQEQQLNGCIQRCKSIVGDDIYSAIRRLLVMNPHERVHPSYLIQANQTFNQTVAKIDDVLLKPAQSVVYPNSDSGIIYFTGTKKIQYKGSVLQNKYHGQGHLFNQNPLPVLGSINYKDLRDCPFWERYEGEFKFGKKHGYGILYFTNGEKWAGEFVDDQPSGYGTWYGQSEEINSRWIKGIQASVKHTNIRLFGACIISQKKKKSKQNTQFYVSTENYFFDNLLRTKNITIQNLYNQKNPICYILISTLLFSRQYKQIFQVSSINKYMGFFHVAIFRLQQF
ncbi:hypothetical protein pb186bvf_002347 [Paramecium bursaria]